MRLYDITKFATLFAHEESMGLAIPRRHGVSSKSDLELLDSNYTWQITYKFSAARHSINSYERDGWSNRQIYEWLTHTYCHGRYFVDVYLNEVYPFTLKSEFNNRLSELKTSLILDYQDILYKDKGIRITQEGKLDRRHNEEEAKRSMRESFREFRRTTSHAYDDINTEMAMKLKHDLKRAIVTGEIQHIMHVSPRKKTQDERLKAGLPPVPSFYATGELINSCQFFVRMELKSWLNQYENTKKEE